ncbi:MAG: hypothetical protein IPJ27_06425 [Candidatus Accumulibacter sp.]|uniref:Uncharacterized protein n=1 Tax=Candidatus Accumulibacter proximus TaxID=2954385 RepID=A0A935UGG3_9PROT|nr:hypothetical protein [Candidatus Accumulibacter proximus]
MPPFAMKRHSGFVPVELIPKPSKESLFVPFGDNRNNFTAGKRLLAKIRSHEISPTVMTWSYPTAMSFFPQPLSGQQAKGSPSVCEDQNDSPCSPLHLAG